MKPTTNYFVCTLGEAANIQPRNKYTSVNDLVYQLGTQNEHDPAIGFFVIDGRQDEATWRVKTLTFGEVLKTVIATAGNLQNRLKITRGSVVGLLSASTPEFFFVWLASAWLGCPILLIAPECSPSGVAALCKSCDVSCLLSDGKHVDLASKGKEEFNASDGKKISTFLVDDIFGDQSVLELNIHGIASKGIDKPIDVNPSDIAYFHHTSGTSSGTPKPIPQSHHGAVGALPCLTNGGEQVATFTTTPLYHGGPADTFRAWTSGAMIYLFPSASVPVTAANVIKCLEVAKQSQSSQQLTSIRYFTSVPYILQIMADSRDGLQWLQSMHLVGVGGAALAKDIGDQLVRSNVNLVSRYGSAECGFLMCSHRDYDNDKEWQYLRIPEPHPFLRLESREDGLSELIVLKGWPHMAKTNRDDGSYATSDLFEKHATIENAWRYHSRADSQLTLQTGKKFDPAPLEDTLTASSKMLAGAFIFGNNKPYPGVLVFRSEQFKAASDGELLGEIWPVVQKLNDGGQAHVKLAKNMIIAMPYVEVPLDKTSKGTLLRGRAEDRYRDIIERAYTDIDEDSTRACSDEELPSRIQSIAQGTTSKQSEIGLDADLFSLGIDSIAGMRIRQLLQKLVPKDGSRLPINVVEDCGTINKLVVYIRRARSGDSNESATAGEDANDEMQRLVMEYSDFGLCKDTNEANDGTHTFRNKAKIAVLTGATGSLGAHVLDQLRNDSSVEKIYCLVRGVDQHAAFERVTKALQQRDLSPLEAGDSRVVVVSAKLGEDGLGLDKQMYKTIANDVTIIVHCAWSVNFRMKLRSFAKDNLAGVHNLVKLALQAPGQAPKFVFCSSTASVLAYSDITIPERILTDSSVATSTGYAQSKWVAEQICHRASQLKRLRDKVVVLRVGQLSGDTKTGAWNAKEAWPLMLSTAKLVGCLPQLNDEVLDWLPVDLAARIVVESTKSSEANDESLSVLHVLNTHQQPSWSQMLNWLGRYIDFETVAPRDWLERMDRVAEEESQHPAMQLLDFWREMINSEKRTESIETKGFAVEDSKRLLPAMAEVKDLDEHYVGQLWCWIDANVGEA